MPGAWEREEGKEGKQDQKYCSVLISSHKRDIKNGQENEAIGEGPGRGRRRAKKSGPSL